MTDVSMRVRVCAQIVEFLSIYSASVEFKPFHKVVVVVLR